MALPNSTVLALMRSQAESLFSTSISVYDITLTYDAYGQQIPASGLLFSSTGYVGAIRGNDNELLLAQENIGTLKEEYYTVLAPIANTFNLGNIVKNGTTEYKVVWSNTDTQDSVQLYSKAICTRYVLEAEKRRIS